MGLKSMGSNVCKFRFLPLHYDVYCILTIVFIFQNAPTDTSQEDSNQNIPQQSPEEPETTEESKVIPRLVNTTVPLDILNSIDPVNWTEADVAKFLTVNDCQPYCVNFANITGPMMLQLSKDEIIALLEMKVGPSLKIFDLIQQLKCKIKQPQCRYK